MNSSATIEPNKRPAALVCDAVAGSKKLAKFRPICRPITSPAISTAANTMRTAKPSATPISTCCTTSSSAAGESSGTLGISGSVACAATVMKKASATRTRIGTMRWPSTGSDVNSASARRNGHSSGVIHASSCASVKVSMRSAPGRSQAGALGGQRTSERGARRQPTAVGIALQRALDVLDQRGQHPRSGDREHHHGGDDLGHERQRGFVDLRGGLQHADHQADHQHGDQHRRGHRQHQHQALLAERENLLGIHGGTTRWRTTRPANRAAGSSRRPARTASA